MNLIILVNFKTKSESPVEVIALYYLYNYKSLPRYWEAFNKIIKIKSNKMIKQIFTPSIMESIAISVKIY
jgi:hypothetical protein